MALRFAIACTLIGWLLTACGPAEERVVLSTKKHIVHGTVDNLPQDDAVVAISIDNSSLCSGTLVTPRVVVTAAHCVAGHSSFKVKFGPSTSSPIATINVIESSYYPGWDPANIRWDIALLRMESDAPAGVNPFPFLTSANALTTADQGKTIRFAGFGRTETGSVGVKLTVENELNWVCESTTNQCQVGSGYVLSPSSIGYDETPGGPCNGDSGGPAFITINGTEYLAGITSYGDQNCSLFGCSTKIDAYEQYVMDFIGTGYGTTPNGDPCQAAYECESGFCIDGVCCDTDCGECNSCILPGSEGTCTPITDGTSCDDGDMCNGEEVCQAGSCVQGTPPLCEDGNPCTRDICNPNDGSCSYEDKQDGEECSDGDNCNGLEVCISGVCDEGIAVDCDDQDPCTADLCNEDGSCNNVPMADGEHCGQCLICDTGQCVEEEICTNIDESGNALMVVGSCATTGSEGPNSMVLLLAGIALMLATRRRK